MGLRRMLVRMLDSEGNADGSKVVGIAGGKAAWVDPTGGGTGTVESVVAGTHIDVDDTDPANPVVSAYVPLTTVVDGVPDLVWDEDNNLVTTKGP